jgi:hypothetical protein
MPAVFMPEHLAERRFCALRMLCGASAAAARNTVMARFQTECRSWCLQLEFVYNNAGYIATTQPVQYNAQFDGANPPAQPQTYYKPPGV